MHLTNNYFLRLQSKLMSLTKEEYMERTPSEFSNELETAANLPDPVSKFYVLAWKHI